jgi:two-component system sensor histidine kinase CpxA
VAPKGAPSKAQELRGRFLVRTGEPAAYWLGVRVPIPRPVPVTFVVRVESWWSLMRLLDLQVWLLTAGGVVAFSILFWLPFVHGVTRALRQLTVATGEIAEGNFDARVPESRRDELGALGGSVNRMAARLDTYVKGQKKFLGDIAHELGSPLGRLQVAVEILESRADPALQAQVADVREEVQQMSELVNELLAFTKAGLRPRTAELAVVELAPLVREVAAREDATGRVALAVTDDIRARADAPLLARAIGNLVRNAVRYAGDAGLICVTARREGEQVLVLVEDDGPGVPPDALDRLGEPFFRPEVARTRETGGVGLGLSIVRSSVAACGGEVRFANRTPRGFRAEVRLTAV